MRDGVALRNFSISDNPLRRYFESEIAKYTSRQLPLEYLHNLNDDVIEDIRFGLYESMRSIDFQRLYHNFSKNVIPNFRDNSYLIQDVPSIRIQLPNRATVNYHSDYWYGHGDDTYTIWSPLVKTHKTNTLYMSNLTQSICFEDECKINNYTIREINELARRLCSPIVCDYGQSIIFNSHVVHGAEVSKESTTRFSIDFRYVNKDGDIGYKQRSAFVEVGNLNTINVDSRRVFAYLNMHNDTLVCQRNQLETIKSYAKSSKCKIIAVDTEIVTLDYSPALTDLVNDSEYRSDYDAVLMYSIQLLPKNSELRRNILECSLRNNINIIFANEGFVFDSPQKMSLLEQYYKNKIL